MVRSVCALLLFAVSASPAFAGPTRVRSGQVDFSGGINENLRVAGDLASTGTVSADVLSVTGAAAIGDRIEVGDSSDDLTITVAASTFNAMIGDATAPSWRLDEVNYSVSPRGLNLLETGMLHVTLSPGTRLYQVIVHGVFTDTDSSNELRARIYKQNIAFPTNPSPLTNESVEAGGTSGTFSLTLTPDYVVEEGYAVILRVQIKNTNPNRTFLFGAELILHETIY